MFQQQVLKEKSVIAVDPVTTPHEDWVMFEKELDEHILKSATNFVPHPTSAAEFLIKSHNSSFSGVVWQEKVKILREKLARYQCNAIVISSLSEIAYLLNVRSTNFEYVPVFRAYLIVTQDQVVLYTNRSRVTLGPQLQFKFDMRNNKCLSNNCVE